MIEWIFRTATVVVFVLMLIAALVTSGQCLGEGVTVWLASGLLSLAFTRWVINQRLQTTACRPA